MERIPYGYYRGSLSPVTEDTPILGERLFVALLRLNIIRLMPLFQELTRPHGMPLDPRSDGFR